MKKTCFILLAVFLLVQGVYACDIEIGVHGDAQEHYKTGDEIIFKVDVHLTHRVCPYGIDATEFSGDGLELLGATPWKKLSDYDYARLVKAKVESDAKDKATLKAVRTCEKGGATETLKIKIK